MTGYTTWSATDIINSSLDTPKLKATATATGGAGRAIQGQSSGKYYWEGVFSTAGNNNTGVGIATSTAPLSSLAANATGACMIYKGFPVWLNGSSQGTSIGIVAQGDVVAVAVNIDAKLIWFRLGASGSWNATSGTANDPATGTGGISLSALTPPYYPATSEYQTGDAITANFGQNTFVGAIPSGYVGWPAATPFTANLTGAQIGASAGTITTKGAGAILGVQSSGAVGTLGPHTSKSATLIGAQITSQSGAINRTIRKPLLGAQVSAFKGELQYGNDRRITFLSRRVVTSAGHITAKTSTRVSLTGAQISSRVSPLVKRSEIALHGAGLSTSAHSPRSLVSATGFHMTDLQVTMDNLPPEDHSVSIVWSNDKGATWGNPIERSIGKGGEYLTSIMVHRLGLGRDRVFQLEWSCPTITALAGVFIDTSESQS